MVVTSSSPPNQVHLVVVVEQLQRSNFLPAGAGLAGGNGATSSITGTPTARAGGGGGGLQDVSSWWNLVEWWNWWWRQVDLLEALIQRWNS